jgi:hypothetical protein
MKKLVHGVLGAVMLAAAAGPLLAADAVSDCQDNVIKDCNEVLKDCKWWEKPLIGIVCTGMFVACGGVTIALDA